MKKFMFMHVGFEKPTPEIMAAWKSWFESIADKQLEQGGLMNGRELSEQGKRELPWDKDAITGFNIIQAESIEEAQQLAESNPYISSIRIYEIRSM
ncbi:MAG: YciI family protein [Oceanococcus sp.]